MEINDESTLPILDREVLMGTLAEQNKSRYEMQAIEFVEAGTLTVELGDAILKYENEDAFCMAYVSYDKGINFFRLGGRRLNPSDGRDDFRVFWEFADKEARVLLRS